MFRKIKVNNISEKDKKKMWAHLRGAADRLSRRASADKGIQSIPRTEISVVGKLVTNFTF